MPPARTPRLSSFCLQQLRLQAAALLLGALTLAEIVQHQHHAAHAGPVEEVLGHHLARHRGAVCSRPAELARGHALHARLVEERPQPRALLRGDELVDRALLERRRGVAEQALDRGGLVEEPPPRVDHQDHVGEVLDQRAQPVLALGQGLLGPLPLERAPDDLADDLEQRDRVRRPLLLGRDRVEAEEPHHRPLPGHGHAEERADALELELGALAARLRGERGHPGDVDHLLPPQALLEPGELLGEADPLQPGDVRGDPWCAPLVGVVHGAAVLTEGSSLAGISVPSSPKQASPATSPRISCAAALR